MQNELEEPVSSLKGVGKKRLCFFEKLGIKTCFDLLCYFPVGYEDCSKISFVSDAVNGKKCCVRAKIIEKSGVVGIRNLRIMKALAVDGNGDLFNLVFFNNDFIFSRLMVSEFYIFFGKVERFGKQVQMVSPRLILKNEMGLLAKYGLVANLSRKVIVNQIKQVLNCFKIHENLPKRIIMKFNLVDRHKAFFDIHFPADDFCLKQARKRLVFEELFFWQLHLNFLKKAQLKKTNVALNVTNLSEFLKFLPFKLSSSQVEVLNECISDCKKNVAMMRLIQGDVGCGKTVIVQALCYLFVLSGFQAAVMVPTEILARQHYENFRVLFSNFKMEVGLLVGSLKKAEQVSVLSGVASGRVNILIGTHSLFSKRTVFKNLGFVATDEQHRFGVLQRGSLIKKGQAPHVIIISATPVPRTLAIVFFADVNVSIVKQAPFGRAKTRTFHIPPSKRLRAFSFLAKEVAKGRQAYIVCPLIEDGLKKAVAVEPYFEKLKALKELKGFKLAMLHGRQTSEQKAFLMNEFVKGKIDVLLATSMIEVGIDNPNATVIIIENAEMFGLASLHQLRGRVGRGEFDSFCILISGVRSDQAKERMRAMCEMASGFEISKVDLKLRGPGQFFGTQQHGLPEFKIARLFEDYGLLQLCSKEAENFLGSLEELNLKDRKCLNRLVHELNGSEFVL